MQAVHELVAHAIQPNIGGVDFMKHKLVLVVHKVLCGALHVAEQLPELAEFLSSKRQGARAVHSNHDLGIRYLHESGA